MALSEIDRSLLQRCLAREPRAWEDFVDRFLGLVVHVVNHTAHSRGLRLAPDDVDDLVAEVFLVLVHNDFSVLRHFRGDSSLATYLTVVARRAVVHQLSSRHPMVSMGEAAGNTIATESHVEQRLTDRDEVAHLIEELDGMEAEIVRLYHLEGKSYREISSETGVGENSIGPTLSRARDKMRRAATDPTS